MRDEQYEKTMEHVIDSNKCQSFVSCYDYTFYDKDKDEKKTFNLPALDGKELKEYTSKYGTCIEIMPVTMY